MTVNDPKLTEIIVNRTPTTIQGKQYIVEPNPSGSCDGCAFINTEYCPTRATYICTSNGGNILIPIQQKP